MYETVIDAVEIGRFVHDIFVHLSVARLLYVPVGVGRTQFGAAVIGATATARIRWMSRSFAANDR